MIQLALSIAAFLFLAWIFLQAVKFALCFGMVVITHLIIWWDLWFEACRRWFHRQA